MRKRITLTLLAAGAEQRTISLLADGQFATDADLPASLQHVSPDESRVFFTTKETLAGADADATYDSCERTRSGALIHVSDDPTGTDDNGADADAFELSSDGPTPDMAAVLSSAQYERPAVRAFVGRAGRRAGRVRDARSA